MLDEERERDRRDRLQRIGGLRGLGYTLLGYACEALAVLSYVLYVLPKVAWLRFTGRIPPRG